MQAPQHSETLPAGFTQHIVDAEVSFAMACRRLENLRRGALLGGEYDPDAYDAAVVDLRSARTVVAAARRLREAAATRFTRVS